ncbi:MAG: N-acetyltransferase [Planctomycetota bacterium]
MSNNEVEILPVNSSKLMKHFIKFPWKIYNDDKKWAPPLISEIKKKFNQAKNPFFQYGKVQSFLARRNGGFVGRITAIYNPRHNQYHNDKVGFFGLFDAINDVKVAEPLFQVVKNWLTEYDRDIIRGPFNFSTNDESGLLIEGFDDPPQIMMPYNPPYYADLIESCGLKKVKDLYAYTMDANVTLPEKFYKVAELVRKKTEITFRSIDFSKIKEEIKLIKEVYNKAWAPNWGFFPMTEKEFEHMGKELKKIAAPEIILIAEAKGEPVGFSLALPDINQALMGCNGRLFPFGIFKLLKNMKKINRIRVLVLGVIEGYRRRGIDALFYLETFKRAVKLGYKSGEMSWILEDNNAMNNALVALGAHLYKKYRIYEAPIK